MIQSLARNLYKNEIISSRLAGMSVQPFWSIYSLYEIIGFFKKIMLNFHMPAFIIRKRKDSRSFVHNQIRWLQIEIKFFGNQKRAHG